MREQILLDTGWKFHRGDIEIGFPRIKGTAYMSAKTERAKLGPACKDYVISGDFSKRREHHRDDWENVMIPHDFMMSDGFDRHCNEALGFCTYDNAWYVNRFTTEPGDEKKRLTLYFEGVATHATVWVNGCLMKHNFCGYTSFEVDITDVVRFDTDNVISVYVTTQDHEGWWYEGGGIYRPVYLVKTAKTAVDLYGVYIKPELQSDNTWKTKVETTLRNDTDEKVRLRVEHVLIDENENEVAAFSGATQVELREKKAVNTEVMVENPILWNPLDAHLYTLRTKVFRGSKQVDEVTNRFGYRSFEMNPDKGLFVNGKPCKIKGFCGHESVWLCGKSVPDNIQRYRVQLMKEMGANGYRTSHYPQSVAMMDALDEAGFIVMDETRWFESTEEGLSQLEMVIKRDRNRPSVFFWSVANEEPFAIDERGGRILRTMKAFAKKLDDRPITMGVTHAPEEATVFADCDVIGINYKWDHYEAVREMYPDKPIVTAECGATGTTRGWYFKTDSVSGHNSAYDATINNAFRSRERTWKFIFERPYIMGGYHWNLAEYRGEAAWPCLSSKSGALDICLEKKDAFWQHQAYFTDEPMIHLLPHWNWQGMEGQNINVWAYTNAPKAEIFLDGKSLGICEVERYGHAEWSVPYKAGKLVAKAMDEQGNVVAEDVRETTGKPWGLRLTLRTPDLKANGRDLAFVTCEAIDEAGRVVPDAEPVVRFVAEGAGKVYSTGAVNTDHDIITVPERKMWAGSCTAAIRIGKEVGVCKVIATSPGLESAILEFEVK